MGVKDLIKKGLGGKPQGSSLKGQADEQIAAFVVNFFQDETTA